MSKAVDQKYTKIRLIFDIRLWENDWITRWPQSGGGTTAHACRMWLTVGNVKRMPPLLAWIISWKGSIFSFLYCIYASSDITWSLFNNPKEKLSQTVISCVSKAHGSRYLEFKCIGLCFCFASPFNCDFALESGKRRAEKTESTYRTVLVCHHPSKSMYPKTSKIRFETYGRGNAEVTYWENFEYYGEAFAVSLCFSQIYCNLIII